MDPVTTIAPHPLPVAPNPLPGCFHFDEIRKLIEHAWQESLSEVAPTPTGNIVRVRRQGVGAGDPSVAHPVDESMDPIAGPIDEIHHPFQQTFCQPISNRMGVSR